MGLLSYFAFTTILDQCSLARDVLLTFSRSILSSDIAPAAAVSQTSQPKLSLFAGFARSIFFGSATWLTGPRSEVRSVAFVVMERGSLSTRDRRRIRTIRRRLTLGSFATGAVCAFNAVD